LTSSGGHSPWSYPIMVYSRQKNVIAKFSDMIDGKPTLSGDFRFQDLIPWPPPRGSSRGLWMTRLPCRSIS
jgi:hypothetical protein